MSLSNYTRVERPDMAGKCWLHNTKPVWIVECFPTVKRAHNYQVFKATGDIPEGGKPWETTSTRISDPKHGFKTVEEAAKAGDESC